METINDTVRKVAAEMLNTSKHKKKNTNNYTITLQIALKNVIWSICECKAD